jgi:uncharacterized protein YjbI with pentapeptide repeats
MLLLVLFLYLHSFLEHKSLLEKEIATLFMPRNALEKLPTIFNLEQISAKSATFIWFYVLPLALLVLFSLRASSMHRLTYYGVNGITVIAVWIVLWKSLCHADLLSLKVRTLSSLLVSLVVFGILTLVGTTQDPYRWNLSYVNLKGNNLYGRRDLKNLNFTQAVFDGANLRRADLSQSALVRASFDGADLRDTIFDDANLTGAFLPEANLERARLYRVNLAGGNLYKANVSKTDFGERANLEGANFHGADLSGSGLRKARLHLANLRGDLSFATLNEADLHAADALGAKLVGTKLQKANLSDVTLEKGDDHRRSRNGKPLWCRAT